MIYTDESTVFKWLVSIIGSTIFLTWCCILFLHFRFRVCLKAQGNKPEDLPYVSWGYPYRHYLASVIAFCCMLSSIYLSIDTKPSKDDPDYSSARDSWAQGMLGAWSPWGMSLILYFGYKFFKSTKIVNPAEADLDTGRWIPKALEENAKPVPKWKKILSNFI
ncbi:hypothetical protein BGX27_007356 [Mortierella sp. AM989]|nr:hypothetical protein BGX27_007356 [Mortierella sp. AM989]